jgi:tRNA (guanine37-N1)-methyltransferase
MNLNEEHLPYKELIGQVILEKNKPRITLVVNKLNSIESEFRTFEFEVIAAAAASTQYESGTAVSSEQYQVIVSESNCSFQFKFGEVYWNSKLQKEHDRILTQFVDKTKREVVVDLFAGIGPFSIPAAKYHNATVYANDLNPKSYEYLKSNIKLNKLVDYDDLFEMVDYVNRRAGDSRTKVSSSYFHSSTTSSTSTQSGGSGDLHDQQRRAPIYSKGYGKMTKRKSESSSTMPTQGMIYATNENAISFIAKLVQHQVVPDHIIMNLPATAVTFLPYLKPWRRVGQLTQNRAPTPGGGGGGGGGGGIRRTLVHCYCFTTSDDPFEDVVHQVEMALELGKGQLKSPIAISSSSSQTTVVGSCHQSNGYLKHVENVRTVSKNKHMMCVSFYLPPLYVD